MAQPVPIHGPRADHARRVADVLRQQIHTDAYPDGLPPEHELAGEFSVSRNTVREALAVLKHEGLIDRGPKVGTRVARRKYDHGLDALLGLKETFKNLGQEGEVRNEVRAAMPVTAPPAVARRLQLAPGEQAVFVERLRYLGDLPHSLDVTYLAPDIGTQILDYRRPVAPYFVPVPELDGLPPVDRAVHEVEQPPLVGGQAPATTRSRIASATTVFEALEPPSPRIAEVLALEEPTMADLGPYLTDSEPGVRRTAVTTLTESLPDGYAPALFAALDDHDAAVRRTAAEGIRELVAVLPEPGAARAYLRSGDMVVRAASVYLLAARRAGVAADYRHALQDPDHRVRIEAVRALVSVDDVAGVVEATGDENREVRIAAASGLATLGDAAQSSGAVRVLVGDPDPLVRAAALAALGELGCEPSDFAVVARALRAPAWQVREGAARGLKGAAADVAVPALAEALADAHLDVRKAAVLSLTRWAGEPAARDALGIALKDGDADVRAYARRALERSE